MQRSPPPPRGVGTSWTRHENILSESVESTMNLQHSQNSVSYSDQSGSTLHVPNETSKTLTSLSAALKSRSEFKPDHLITDVIC